MKKGIILILFLVISLGSYCQQLSLDGFRWVIVAPLNNDQFGVDLIAGKYLEKKGFKVAATLEDIPKDERLGSIYILISYRPYRVFADSFVEVTIKFHDVISKRDVAMVSGKAMTTFSIKRGLQAAVRKAINSLNYGGYSPKAYENNISRRLPKVPSYKVTEKDIKDMKCYPPLEGIWKDTKNFYRIGFISSEADPKYYSGIILSPVGLWKIGEEMIRLEPTATKDVFVGNIRDWRKEPQGVTVITTTPGIIEFKWTEDGNPKDISFVKIWPSIKEQASTTKETNNPPQHVTGSGFLVSSSGLLATNWHVVEGSSSILIEFPAMSLKYKAEIRAKSPKDDLAVLELKDFSLKDFKMESLPYGFSPSYGVDLGETVFVIGYPLESVLGRNPKFTMGNISSKTGLFDDACCYQISTPIQPGNSGSPLFDDKGDIIGTVFSSVNAKILWDAADILPQNINFAVKAERLLSLLTTIPGFQIEKGRKETSNEEKSKCVGLVRVELKAKGLEGKHSN